MYLDHKWPNPDWLLEGQKNQIQRLQHCSVGKLEDFNRRLASLPFMSLIDFQCCSVIGNYTKTIEFVPVKKIIGGPAMKSWFLTDRQIGQRSANEYIWEFADKIQKGDFVIDIERPEVHLTAVGNVFFITSNGRHRVAALKGLLGENVTVKAIVERVSFPVNVSTSNSYSSVRFKNLEFIVPKDLGEKDADLCNCVAAFEYRRKLGLWEYEECLFNTRPSSYLFSKLFGEIPLNVTWKVNEIKYPWVFAKNLSKAKAIYEEVTST